MARFNTKPASTKTVNRAGGDAFRMTPKMELVHTVLSTFLKDEFYESGAARIERISQLIADIAKKDPVFIANLAVIARREYHLRSVTAVLLGELAKVHNGDDLLKRAIVASTERPDDLTELASYLGAPSENLPKQVKRGIRNALLKFDEYALAKYKGDGRAVKLVDLFNHTHPNPKHATSAQAKAWEALINGTLKNTKTWESQVSNAKDEQGRKKAFSDLILEGQMGYMALLRNLNNLVKYDVDERVIDAAVAKLTDPEAVAKSKQLPFRFLTAYEAVSGNRKFTDAISEAMDLSVANVPSFDGKTLIAVDVSGSMTGNNTIQKAAVFAGALMKANDADVVLYDTNIKEYTASSRTPVVDIANGIISQATGGGTETALVFDFATNRGRKYDRIFILSDQESWHEGYYRSNVQNAYKDYTNVTGQDPYIYAIDIQGYGTNDVKGGRVFHLTGWSERLLDFVKMAESGDDIVAYVEQYVIE